MGLSFKARLPLNIFKLVFTNYSNVNIYITDNSKAFSYTEINNVNKWQHNIMHYIYETLNVSDKTSLFISFKRIFSFLAVVPGKDSSFAA